MLPKGIGSAELIEGIERLLTTRVSALDVGRADLGSGLDRVDADHAQRRLLDLAVRLGAHWVTAGTAVDVQLQQIQREFSEFAGRCTALQIVPLLAPPPMTGIGDLRTAMQVAEQGGGGVVLNVHTDIDPDELELLIVEKGHLIGYVRLQGEELDAFAADPDQVPELLATLPVHVPVAVGDDRPPMLVDKSTLIARARAWRLIVDRMLEHPKAKAARLTKDGQDRAGG